MRKRPWIACLLLSLVTGLLSLGFFIAQDGGALTIRADFDLQQIPFTMALHNQIARGGLSGWCWNLDLGASAIQGFGFYELGSPFFWASMAFPANAFPYLVGWLYLTKYVVASMTSYLYFKRFVRHPAAITAALLYAFSGFQATNLLFYHFHDVVACFPLMLVGIEKLMEDDRRWYWFMLSTALNCLVNYVFFVQSAIFLVLYFGFRFAPQLWRQGWRTLVRALLRCLAAGTLGVGIAAVLLVPSLIYVRQNPRATATTLGLSDVVWNPGSLALLFEGILLPGEAMHAQSIVYQDLYLSRCCWLPMVGVSLAIAYVRRQRDWLGRLLIMLLVISLSPILVSAFLLMTGMYFRWWYVFVLMLALASAHVIDEPDAYHISFGALVNALLIVGLFAFVHVYDAITDKPVVFDSLRFAILTAIALAGIACTMLLAAKRQQLFGAFATAVVAFCVASTSLTLSWYRAEWQADKKSQVTHELVTLGTKLDVQDPQYRYATSDNRLTLTGDAAGTSAFSSTISLGSGRLEKLMGFDSAEVFHLKKERIQGLSELLGGRYQVSDQLKPEDLPVATYSVGDTSYFVNQRPACPIGILRQSFVTEDQLSGLDAADKTHVMIEAPVVNNKDAQLAAHYAARRENITTSIAKPIAELVETSRNDAVDAFKRGDWGMSCIAHTTTRCLCYLSIPNDEGWTAWVNGNETPIIESGGMMLLGLEPGTNQIELRFVTPGVKLGMTISLASILIAVTLISRQHLVAKRLLA
ncbi:MAG: YfhO family protein [Coriobacteriales bacterium]|nr:YfhO family protein [Coriobacteriales bacterium]